ncbi:MAG: hypothetical protein M3317_13650 [Actinomycetota bacterium]|nr:hypothetical protein [Actinomycetota bacterium]
MAQMHASKDQLPAERLGDYEGRMTQFGDYYVNFESIPAGMGGPELFKGLPDDACQSEHWGYIFKGKVRFSYTDGSEDIINAGEAYYAKPGHVFEALEDSETVEFSSPKEQFEQLLEVVGKNLEAMGDS